MAETDSGVMTCMPEKKKTMLSIALVAAIWLTAGLSQTRADGDCESGAVGPVPDPAFGDGGLVMEQFHVGDDLGDLGIAAAVQSDGRLVVGGHASTPDDARDGAVMRLLPDGQPDPEFGDEGRLLLGIANPGDFVSVRGVEVLADGRIVLVGRDRDTGWFFARLHPDGSFDTSFDLNGVRIISLDADSHFAHDLAVQADGKLVGAGFVQESFDVDEVCAKLIRLDSDGSNDETFGENGQVCLTPDEDADIAGALDVTVLPDGRILAAGLGSQADSSPELKLDMLAFRLMPDGQVDTTFGEDGWRFIVFDQGGEFHDRAFALTVDSSDSLVLAGFAESLQSSESNFVTSMAAARLTPDGDPDPGFGSGGRVTVAFDHDGEHHGVDQAAGLTVLDDGRILLAGVAPRRHSADTFPQAGAATVLHADGDLDTCFGDDGRWVQSLPGPQDIGLFRDIAHHSDRIYLVGYGDVPQTDDPSRTRTDIMITAMTISGEIFSDRFEE